MKSKTQKIVKIVFLITLLFSIFSVEAQIYSGPTYQAVVRNSSNVLISNTVVGVKISILQSTPTGTVVFSERHTPTTNANGLATFVISEGTSIIGSYFGINWLTGPYFIKTETDPTGGTNYTISGTSQINSVPYALWTENAYYATNSGDSWKRTGNIVDASNEFIGSTNDANVIFKRNNIKAGFIGQNNVALGRTALNNSNPGNFNVAIGPDALALNSGNFNIATGFESQYVNTAGIANTSYGHGSLRNNTVESYNTAIGYESLRNTTGGQNTAIGWQSLNSLTTGGGNIGIGKLVNVPSPTANDQLSIGNVIYGTGMGNTTNGKIGIGVAVPTEKLEVAGKTKTTDMQVTAGAGINKVLISDATGNATWQNSNINTGFHVESTLAQTIPGTLRTKINFNNEITDDANAFDLATDEWTIPSTGFYHIHAAARFLNDIGNTYIEILIYINGVPNKIKASRNYVISNPDISADIKLNANDKVTIYILHNSGSTSQNLTNTPGTIYFSGFKVY